MFVYRKTNSWNSFSLFFHVRLQHGKLVNRNLIPVNTENTTLTKKSVFLLIRTGKHFPFLSHIFLLGKCLIRPSITLKHKQSHKIRPSITLQLALLHLTSSFASPPLILAPRLLYPEPIISALTHHLIACYCYYNYLSHYNYFEVPQSTQIFFSGLSVSSDLLLISSDSDPCWKTKRKTGESIRVKIDI